MFQYKCPACARFGTTEKKICPRCGRALRDADVYDTDRTVPDNFWSIVGWTSLGVILTLVYLYFGVAFGGAGHGWMIPMGGACTALITIPLTGLAWALRWKENGWWIALSLMLFEIFVDVYLVLINLKDSSEDFKKGWEAAPVWVIVWAILFLAHQVIAPVIVFVYKGRPPRTEEHV